MNYSKIRQEIISFIILIVVSVIIMAVSAVYIKMGFDDDLIVFIIGGALFLFLGAYSFIVFVKRINKCVFARKVGDLILYDKERSIQSLAKKLNVVDRKVVQAIVFLVNNEYIEGIRLERGLIISRDDDAKKPSEEKEELNQLGKVANKTNLKKYLNSAKCENCGATIVFNGEKAICPYCGNLLSEQNK